MSLLLTKNIKVIGILMFCGCASKPTFLNTEGRCPSSDNGKLCSALMAPSPELNSGRGFSFESFDQITSWAESEFGDAKSRLTAEEFRSLDYYKEVSSLEINNYLETGVKPVHTNKIDLEVHNIDQALNKYRLDRNLLLYRSIQIARNTPLDNPLRSLLDSPDSMIGQKIERRAFTSVSLAAGQTYQMHANAPWNKNPEKIPIFFEITVKRGTPAIYLDPPLFTGNGRWQGLSEYEILLPRNGAFLIKKIYIDKVGRIRVEAEFLYQQP